MDETAGYTLGRKSSSWSLYFMSFGIVYVQLALDKFANVRSFALALSNGKFETENRPWTEEKKQAQRRKKWAISVLERKQKHLTGSHKKKSVSGNCDIKRYSCFEKGCLTNGKKPTRQCRKLLWVMVVLTVAWLNRKVFQRDGRKQHKRGHSSFFIPCCWITMNFNQAQPNSYCP